MILAIVLSSCALVAPDRHCLVAFHGESLEARAHTADAFRLAFADRFGVEIDLRRALSDSNGLDAILSSAVDGVRLVMDASELDAEQARAVRAAVCRHQQIRDENLAFIGMACRDLFPNSELLVRPDSGEGSRDRLLKEVSDERANGLCVRWDPEKITGDFVRFFNAAGLRVHVWGANAHEDVAQALANGVATVTCDSPRRILALWRDAFEPPPPLERDAFRLMVFNIWGPYFRNPVRERVEDAVTAIRREKPDVIALQEVTREWWASGMFERLAVDYDVIGRNNVTNGYCNTTPLLFRRDRLSAVAVGSEKFHLKLDPTKGYTWAVFKDKGDRCFTAFSTHFWWKENGGESDYIRLVNAQDLCEGLVCARAGRNAPFIGGGDFNARHGSDALEYLGAQGLLEAWRIGKASSAVSSWHGDPVRDSRGHYRGFVPRREDSAEQSLDHVLVESGVDVLRQRVVRYPAAMDVSDHSPVVVDFRLSSCAGDTRRL